MQVYEADYSVLKYLEKRKLVGQYQKAKKNILQGQYQLVDLKKRKPKSAEVYQFRVNKKYRAFARKIKGGLLVFAISDHQ